MRLQLGTLLVLLVLALAVGPLFSQVSERAARLHRDALVIDAHAHLINRQLYHGGDIGDRYSDGQVDLPRAREGGLDVLLLTIFSEESYYPPRFETKQTLRLLDLALTQIEKNRNVIELALTASGIERINKKRKMAAVLDLEGGFDLDGDLGVLRNFYRLGLRSVQLVAHNWTNNFADSCCSPPKWNGLNQQGRAVVREMSRLGMLIAISHASLATAEQTIELSSDPVIASHDGLKSLNDLARTVSNDLVKRLAAKGGVFCVHLGNEFHNRKLYEWKTWQTRGARMPWDLRAVRDRPSSMSIEEIDRLVAPRWPEPVPAAPDDVLMSPDDWVGVVDRVIQIAGEDHVAWASDFDGSSTLPRGMRDVRDLPLITEAMLRRGYSENRIRKILGDNLLRVFRQVTEKR